MGGRDRPFWVFLLLLVLAHFTLHVGVGAAAAAPDLLTVALLLGSRRLSGAAAAGFGLVLGVIQDALSLFAFGANAVVLTVLGFLGARSRDLFVGDSLLFLAAFLFLGKWLRDVGYDYLAGAAVRGDAVGRLLIDAPIAAAYAAAVGVVLFVIYAAVTGER